MRRVTTIAEVRDVIEDARRGGSGIGLVPTMGFLHEGHLSLMRRAASENGFVVATIFVNAASGVPTISTPRTSSSGRPSANTLYTTSGST